MDNTNPDGDGSTAETIHARHLNYAHIGRVVRFNTEVGPGNVDASIRGELRRIAHNPPMVQVSIKNHRTPTSPEHTVFDLDPGRAVVVVAE